MERVTAVQSICKTLLQRQNSMLEFAMSKFMSFHTISEDQRPET